MKFVLTCIHDDGLGEISQRTPKIFDADTFSEAFMVLKNTYKNELEKYTSDNIFETDIDENDNSAFIIFNNDSFYKFEIFKVY